MKKYGVGIIGYGGFGQFLHKAWQSLPGVEVRIIADLRVNQIEAAHRIRLTTNWREMISSSDVDIVAIVTEPSTHEEIAVACLRAGKNILVEKPLAQHSLAAQNIIEARNTSGSIAAIDLIMRYNPLIRELRRLTSLGVFGRLRRVDVENYAQDESLPGWFWDRDRSGGILIEHAVHFIDLIHFIHPSPVVNVNGLTHTRITGEQDQVIANILYEDGLIASHYHSFARPGFFEKTRIRLAYDLADIDLDGWIPLGGEASILVHPESQHELQQSPYFHLKENLSVSDIRDDSRPDGWGEIHDAGISSRQTIKSGGIVYEVHAMLQGRFDINRSKLDVYSDCVRESILDVCKKLDNPQHTLTAPLEAGLLGLQIGEWASRP